MSTQMLATRIDSATENSVQLFDQMTANTTLDAQVLFVVVGCILACVLWCVVCGVVCGVWCYLLLVDLLLLRLKQ